MAWRGGGLAKARQGECPPPAFDRRLGEFGTGLGRRTHAWRTASLRQTAGSGCLAGGRRTLGVGPPSVRQVVSPALSGARDLEGRDRQRNRRAKTLHRSRRTASRAGLNDLDLDLDWYAHGRESGRHCRCSTLHPFPTLPPVAFVMRDVGEKGAARIAHSRSACRTPRRFHCPCGRLRAGRSPGLRISRACLFQKAFPGRSAHLPGPSGPVASGDLSGHGRGGGCAWGASLAGSRLVTFPFHLS